MYSPSSFFFDRNVVVKVLISPKHLKVGRFEKIYIFRPLLKYRSHLQLFG
jgi:hypothetical protein